MEVLAEWKDIANLLDVPVETLRYWHKRYFPMPFRKTLPCPQGRVFIKKGDAIEWFEKLCRQHPNFYRMRKLRELKG